MSFHKFSFGGTPLRERRMLGKERRDEIEETLSGFGQPQPPVSLKEVEQRADTLTQQAVLEVKSATPTWTERFTRYVGGKVLGKVMTVDSADKAQADDAITRATLQASQNAEALLATQNNATLSAINSRARQTTTSMDFLRQKLDVCKSVSAELEKELADTRARAKQANAVKSFDRSMLEQAVKDLEKRKAVVDGIRDDIDGKVRGTAESFVRQEVAQTDEYLRKTISLYVPDQAPNINAMLLDWVEKNAKGEDVGGCDLMNTLRDASAAMFPGDMGRQARQFAAMERAAKKLVAPNDTWKAIAKKTLVQAGPGAALALTAGFLPGVAAVGAGYAVGYAYRRYKYGANENASLPGGIVSAANTKKEWHQNQVASYYRELAVQAGRDVAKLQSIPDLGARLKALATLKPGTSFNALVRGTSQQLSVVSVRDDIVIVSTPNGSLRSLDTRGDGNGKYLFSGKVSQSTFIHLSVDVNDTGENILTIA